MEDRVRISYYKKLKEVMGQPGTATTNPPAPASPPTPPTSSYIPEDTKKTASIIAPIAKPVAPPIMPEKHQVLEEVQGIAEDEKLLDKFEDPSNEGFTLNYVEKKAHDIRMKYLHSLVMMKILVPCHLKPKTHQTGTIRDLTS